MRAFLLLLIVTVALFWWGGHSLYVSLRNGSPIEISCAEYEKQRPDAEWLRLTHCEPSIENIAFEALAKGTGRVSRVYIPLVSESGPKARVVVERDDEQLLGLITNTNRGTELTKKQTQQLAKLLSEPVEGVIRVGLDLSDKERDELAKLGLDLDPDFAIIEQGAKPRVFGLAFLALGLMTSALMVFRLARRR
jgi:hypothetical protein